MVATRNVYDVPMLPRIVIVGRPNVGKSSLLNTLAGRKVSIVDPTAGVTRDRIATTAEIPPEFKGGESTFVEVIDTGGYGIEDVQNLTADVERQIAMGIAQADLILFLVDAQSGIVALDRAVAKVLRNSGIGGKGSGGGKPVILVSNKVDGSQLEAGAYEAMELGFGEPLMISAVTKHNLDHLYDRIRETFKGWTPPEGQTAETPHRGILVAIVGKRNAGKSTLVNAFAGEQRVIVSEQEGTTRDSIDVRFEVEAGRGGGEKHVFTAIDTAGLRKRKSVAGDIEYYSMHRALRSVRRADVCILVVDATVPLSQVDHQLVAEILRHHRPVAIAVNKWDLIGEKSTQEAYAEYLEKELKQLNFVPIVFISAQAAEGMRDLLGIALNLYEQSHHRVSTSELNQALEEIMAGRVPPAKRGKRAKIYYATQLDVNPPTIGLFVNNPELFDHNYQLFLVNRFRDLLPFAEVPIKLLIRGKDRSPEKA